jgi:hypothetical protein
VARSTLVFAATAAIFVAALAVSVGLDLAEAALIPVVDWLVLLAGLAAAAVAVFRGAVKWARGQPGTWIEAAVAGGLLVVLLLWLVRFPFNGIGWDDVRRGFEQRRRELDQIRRGIEQRGRSAPI